MERRRFLGLAASSVIVAGCLDDGPEGTVLSPPDEYDALAQADLPYPIHGDDLPDATVPDPLRDEQVSTRGFVGDRHVLMTFIFTRCHEACPVLTSNLVQTQVEASENGYADDVAFINVTFDPEHDTADVLREYGEARGADVDADNWYFLRPENEERAHEVVEETFGCAFERNPPDASMEFTHMSLILLVNKDGVVERAYTGEPPAPSTVVDDLDAVVSGYDSA